MTDYNKFLVDKLEEIANQNWNNQNVLNDIKKALLNRKTKRSLALKEKIINRIKVLVHKKSRNTLTNLFSPKNKPKKVKSILLTSGKEKYFSRLLNNILN